MKPILLFDIDGTLLKVRRPFFEKILEEILEEFSLDKKSIQKQSFAGRTDRGIFSEIIESLPDAPIQFEKVKTLYLELIQNKLTSSEIQIIEGAAELIEFTAGRGYKIGLCTGNFREAALKKVEAAGLSEHFSFGGYGCNHENRNHLPNEAHQEFVRLHKREPVPSEYIVIGDTPYDIRCARYFGAKVIAVTTGGFTGKELKQYNPDLIVSNLLESREWL